MIGLRLPSRPLLRRAAVVLAALGIAIGVLTPLVGAEGTGLHLAVADGRLVVSTIEPYSPAARAGLRPGMVAVRVDDRAIYRLPEPVTPTPDAAATPDPITLAIPEPTPFWQPTAPVQVVVDDAALRAIADQPVHYLEAIAPSDLARWTPSANLEVVQVEQWGSVLPASLGFVVVGIAILFGGVFWVSTGRAGASLRELGIPLALATASPFLVDPLTHLWNPFATLLGAVLLPAMLLPLALSLAEHVPTRTERLLAIAGIGVCAVGATVAGAAGRLGEAGFLGSAGLLDAGVTLIPGLMAAAPATSDRRLVEGDEADPAAHPTPRPLRAMELAIAGITPALVVVAESRSYLFVVVGWIVAIGLAGRFTIRPLARLASRAQLQRDLVVAATEAERARVAADIHDDALQELTLLVRRLDAAGDAEGAEIARNVSDRLRAICGDLRLPILDDLGVGPALDWLVVRIERLAGGEVRLERSDSVRPPADVELAFFRIAQEALANAVKHGATPIVVRYRSTAGVASLSVDDNGRGIGPRAPEEAVAGGRYGLFGMQQRAEAIGAILDVRRWPGGGTHVQLEWRAG